MELVRTLLSIYAIMQIVHFALPYVSNTQRPWMNVLAKLCQPGIKVGNQLIARLIPDRRFNVDMGPLAAALLCYVARLILGIFFR